MSKHGNRTFREEEERRRRRGAPARLGKWGTEDSEEIHLVRSRV